MAQLPAHFNAAEHEELKDFSPIPNGDYVMEIEEAGEATQSNNNENNYYWPMIHVVLDGEYKGRKVWVNLNLVNENATAVNIANSQLKAMCEAQGKAGVADTEELVGTPMLCTVTLKKDKTGEYGPQNNITKWQPYSPGQAVASPEAPANAPASNAPTNKPPWMK